MQADRDAVFVARAHCDITGRGMAQVARDAGLSREILGKALSGKGTQGFDTVLKVVGTRGLKLLVEAVRGRGSSPGPRSRCRARISAGTCERRQGLGRIWSGRSFGVK